MTQKKRAGKDRIPEFRSRQEMAKWFDAHDLADYQDQLETVKVKFSKNLSEGLNVRFDAGTLARLRERAQERGIGPTTLVRMWIMEHLGKEKHPAS